MWAPFDKVPLAFTSIADEVNFWALCHLLSFGSAFEREIKAATGKSVKQVTLEAVLGAVRYWYDNGNGTLGFLLASPDMYVGRLRAKSPTRSGVRRRISAW